MYKVFNVLYILNIVYNYVLVERGVITFCRNSENNGQ